MKGFGATLLCVLAVWWLAGAPASAGEELVHRWLFVMRTLNDDEILQDTLALLPRASAAGYTAVVLSDWNLYRLDRAGPDHAARVRRLQHEARAHGLELIPCVMPIGYSAAILGYDPNLAEGLPVKEALFIAADGLARLSPDPPVSLPGGGFERAEGHRFEGWNWQDNPAESTFLDRQVSRGGQASARMDRIGETSPVHGLCRIVRTVRLHPHRQYRLSAWLKTEDFERPDSVRMQVLAGTEGERPLSFRSLEVEPTQDWRQYHVVFNSLESEQARVYIGAWGGKGGRLWWDDVAGQLRPHGDLGRAGLGSPGPVATARPGPHRA